MTYTDTLRKCLIHAFAEYPDSRLVPTAYAVHVGAIETIRDNWTYLDALQELLTCAPTLLERQASMLAPNQERTGTISLVGESQLLFIFDDKQERLLSCLNLWKR